MRTVELNWEGQSSSNYFIREAFNTLRANVLFSGKHVKVIIVTSCFAHEGKSSVSFDLCRNLAESGKKVLLVDADLRKSVMVSRYTKERGVYGLSQILSGQIDAANAVYPTNVEGFDIVFSGPYPPNPTELAGSPAFKEFVDGQRNRYDYIIIDAPPLGLVIDAAVMSGACDGAILVINIGHVKYRMAQGVKSQLEKSGCKILGVVLNQVDRKRSIKQQDNYYGYATYGVEPVTGDASQHQFRQRPMAANPQPGSHAAQPARKPASVASPVSRTVAPTQSQSAPARPTGTPVGTPLNINGARRPNVPPTGTLSRPGARPTQPVSRPTDSTDSE